MIATYGRIGAEKGEMYGKRTYRYPLRMFREFSVDSYDVAAAFYLVKPYSYEKLVQALTRCGAELLEQNQCVMVPEAAG